MTYAFRDNGRWQITGMRARFNGIGGWHTLTDDERAQHGWFPCIEVNAAFNPTTQIRSPASFELADGVVTATYTIWNKTPEQIAAETKDAMHAATQAHVDAVAQSQGYNDGVSLASYVGDPKPQWAAEAEAFVAWRSEVWQAFTDTCDDIANGYDAPTIDEFIASLPAMEWPQ